MTAIGADTRPNECYAYFSVTGEFDPQKITARLGLQPTVCWNKGDRNERTQLERKFSRWSLYTRLDRGMALETHVDDVIEQLEPAREKVVDLLQSVEGGVTLVGHFHRDYPGLYFDASTIARLATLKLGMDMDFYYLYSDKREDS
jgi:hypothetical protein